MRQSCTKLNLLQSWLTFSLHTWQTLPICPMNRNHFQNDIPKGHKSPFLCRRVKNNEKKGPFAVNKSVSKQFLRNSSKVKKATRTKPTKKSLEIKRTKLKWSGCRIFVLLETSSNEDPWFVISQALSKSFEKLLKNGATFCQTCAKSKVLINI